MTRSNDTQDRPIEVLLVEDDDGCALLLQKQLSFYRYGSYQFRRADCLSAALREVAEGGIDLVILDLGLPDSQGLETLVGMREAATDVPIIVMTGWDDEKLAIQTVRHGAQDYIVKGQLDGASLARVIRYAIERFRAQQALVAEHDLLRSLIDNIPDQVYLKDTDSRFVSVNLVTARFFGASSSDEIIGKTDFDFLPHGLAAQFLAEEQTLLRRAQPCINREAAITGADGQTHWVLTTKVPLHDHAGNITGLLGINRDITARREAEEQLREYREHLEELVEARTAELKAANERLEANDKARVEVVSTVSHELKAPIASLNLALANMLNGVVGEVPDRCRSYLRMMGDSSQRLQKTVEDILDMTRLDAKTLRMNGMRIPFTMLVQPIVNCLQAQINAKSLQVTLSLPACAGFVACDHHRMERVVVNVLSNAIKFTPQGGKIQITLRTEVSPPGFLVLEIEDNGVGIHPEHLPQVAKRYFRGDLQVDGIGLGLSISKEIVEIHGGALRVTSPPPGKSHGTLISICLPAVEPPTVVVVGGEEPCKSVSAKLLANDYRVQVCRDGAEAVAAVKREAPYAVVFDFSMASLENAGAIAQIKGDPALQCVPIIAITEADIPETKREILTGFAIPPLKMPWYENDLFTCLEQAVIGSRREG